MTFTETRDAIAQRLHDANHTGTLASNMLYLRRVDGGPYWWLGHRLTAERLLELPGVGYKIIDWPNLAADIDQEALRLALRLKAEGVAFDPD